MAMAEFLRNVRTAASFVAPRSEKSGGQRESELERVRRGAMIWLTPWAVKGFDSSELELFPNFSQENRKRLERSVLAFRDVAEKVPVNEPAKPDQVKKALPRFLEVLDLLKPYLDDTAMRANQMLIEAGPWPDGVVGFVSESRPDSEGEPALFVWMIVDENVLPVEDLGSKSDRIEMRVMDVLRNIGRWVYMRVRAATEMSYFYSTDDDE